MWLRVVATKPSRPKEHGFPVAGQECKRWLGRSSVIV